MRRARKDRFHPGLLAGLALLALTACRSNAEDDLSALHRILEDERRAHLETDAELLVSHVADTLVSVEDGRVTRVPRAELARRFAAYFEGATYRAWDDVESPLIRLSADGRMAWVARRVAVERREADPSAPDTRFGSAWTATYEKGGGRWLMTSVTSTFARDDAARVLAAARRALGLAPPVPMGSGPGTGDVERPGSPPGRARQAVPFVGIRTLARVTVRGSDPGTYSVTVVSATSRRARLEFSSGVTGVVDGERGWMRASGDGGVTAATAATRAFVRGHEVHWNLLFPDTRFAPLSFSGATRFAGQGALRLTGADAAGGAVDVFFAETDTLPLGYEVTDHLGIPEDRVQLVVERWTRRSGLLLPDVVSFRQGGNHFRYRFVDMALLDTVPATIFRAP